MTAKRRRERRGRSGRGQRGGIMIGGGGRRKSGESIEGGRTREIYPVEVRIKDQDAETFRWTAKIRS